VWVLNGCPVITAAAILEATAADRHQLSNGPALDWPRIRIAVRKHWGQLGLRLHDWRILLQVRLRFCISNWRLLPQVRHRFSLSDRRVLLQVRLCLRFWLVLQWLSFPISAPGFRLFDCFVLPRAALDFASETTFRKIAGTNTVRMLLKQRYDLLNTPAAAEIVPDDGMKGVAAVGSGRCALPHNVLDCINACADVPAVRLPLAGLALLSLCRWPSR
jgi:hypothetical protein